MHVHRYIFAISKIDHTDPGLTVATMDKPILERTCPGCSCQLAIGLNLVCRHGSDLNHHTIQVIRCCAP
jgi:hypothetical protein